MGTRIIGGRGIRVIVVILACAMLAGCATVNTTPDNPAQTALQKAKLTSIYFLETYKSQFKDAEAMGAMALAGKLSPGQLEVYRTKRSLLINVKPKIDLFAELVSTGTIPAAGREQEINDILNNLLAAGSKVGG